MINAQSRKHNIRLCIPNDLTLKFNHQDIFDAISSDNLDQFQKGFANLDQSNIKLELENKDIFDRRNTPNLCIFNGSKSIAQMCCLFNAKNCLNYAIEQGCDTHQPDYDKRYCIHFAAAGGDLDIIYKLIENDCDLAQLDRDDNNACHYAAKFNNIDVFNYLYANNVDFNHRNNLGQTPLILAAANNSIDILKLLLDANSKIDINQTTNGIFFDYLLWYLNFPFLIGLLYIMPQLVVIQKQLNFSLNMVHQSISKT